MATPLKVTDASTRRRASTRVSTPQAEAGATVAAGAAVAFIGLGGPQDHGESVASHRCVQETADRRHECRRCGLKSAPPTFARRMTFIAIGGPRGHGDSLAVLAPQFLAEQTCTLLGRARHRAAGARFSIS